MYTNPGRSMPYQAKVWRGGKVVNLGCFATAEEAALCVARSLDGQAAAERPAAAVPLTSEKALQQAQAEGLTLPVAKSKTGYFGVYLAKPGKPKPYQAKIVDGQVGASRQDGAPGLLRHGRGSGAVRRAVAGGAGGGGASGGGGAGSLGGTAAHGRGGPEQPPRAPQGGGLNPAMPPGAFVVEEEMAPLAEVAETGPSVKRKCKDRPPPAPLLTDPPASSPAAAKRAAPPPKPSPAKQPRNRA